MTLPTTALQLRSTVQPDATLTVHLESVPVPVPGPDEVLIQVQATPINPSDIGLLFGAGNLAALAQLDFTPDELAAIDLHAGVAGVNLWQGATDSV